MNPTPRLLIAGIALLSPTACLLAQEVAMRFPEGAVSTSVSGYLADRSPTYVFSGVDIGQEAEARLQSEQGHAIFCRSEIDTSRRTTERTYALEGNLYFCIENLDWASGKPVAFTLTVSLLPMPPAPNADAEPEPQPAAHQPDTRRSRTHTGRRLRHPGAARPHATPAVDSHTKERSLQ
ncbi:hypothetical protein OS176_08415 [Xanthomonadaceae bacterium XH05]|nr:hypothetical protein [Xanthomonadaceae bacterium XH05]